MCIYEHTKGVQVIKLLFLLIFSTQIFASSLLELIEQAQKNDLVEVYKYKLDSTSKAYEATKSSYFPRVDIGAIEQFTSPADSLGAGQIYSAYAEVTAVLIDGFKRENLLEEKEKLNIASKHDLQQIKKDISLEVASIYFNMQIIKADLTSLKHSKIQLQEQLHQQQRFFKAKLTTEDNVARIEAAIANTDYQIELKKYAYDEYASKLHTLTNTEIRELKQQNIIEPKNVEAKELDSIKSMQAQVESIGYKAEQLESTNYPTLILSDKYSYYKYGDDGLKKLGIPNVERIESQNVVTLNLSMRLFDFGTASKQKELVLSEQNALFSELIYRKKEVKENIKLALRAIEKAKKLLYASELSQDASNRTYKIVHKKYKARVVDYVNYLDALSNKIEAEAQYNRALGALQISYAKYYYNAGFDIKDYIK